MTNFEKFDAQREAVRQMFRDNPSFSWSGSLNHFHPRVAEIGVLFELSEKGKVLPTRFQNSVAVGRLPEIEIHEITSAFQRQLSFDVTADD